MIWGLCKTGLEVFEVTDDLVKVLIIFFSNLETFLYLIFFKIFGSIDKCFTWL